MTPVDEERLERIRGNASYAIEILSEARGEAVDYDLDSITWVEGFIERTRKRYGEGGVPESLISTIGCYLGEAIIAEADGLWVDDEAHGPGVLFPNGDCVFPLTKVGKQFERGLEQGESILSFYTVAVSYIAIGALRSRADAPEGAS